MKRNGYIILSMFAIFMATLAGQAQAGKIVLANDEWTLSNTGFSIAPVDSADFVENVTSWFTGGGSGTFHAASTNFGLTGSSLAAAMSSAGHTYTTGTLAPFDLPTLQTFDGIFLAGPSPGVSSTVLTNYVNGGGNVYLAGGTGAFGGSANEAAFWNPFLNAFGLGYGTSFNGVAGVQPISSPHPIFSGPGGVVTGLYQNNGNDSLDINILDPRGQVLVTSSNGNGLYAVFDSGAASVPEPGGVILLGTSLLGLIGWRRRKQRSG